jgi:hypothetical protein
LEDKLANKDIHSGVEIEFADGKKRFIRPLTIRQLRKFMKVANQMKPTDDGQMSEDDIDRMVESAAIALATTDPELAADPDALEDILDLKSYQKLMAAAMGNDPNLL